MRSIVQQKKVVLKNSGQNFYENLSMGRFTTQEGKVSMYDFEKLLEMHL